ncbi:MAG: DUF342 domain-containing protein [Deltaproteobacteria bacterium]|nr:DUF342 domain-containing protein [Deltaproteobacteria bacterium]
MPKGIIRLSYLPGPFRIKAQVTRSEIRKMTPFAESIDEIVARAQKKMSSVRQNQEIDAFSVYKSRFSEFCELCLEKEELPLHEALNFVLAEGSPALSGVELQPGDSEKSLALLTIDAPASEVRVWRPEWLQFSIGHKLKSLGIAGKCNSAQIYGAWIKAAHGETVEDLSLCPAPGLQSSEGTAQKPYTITANKNRKEVILVIRNLLQLVEQTGIPKIIEMIGEATDKVAEQFGEHYQILQKNISQEVQQALNGPERIGMDLPMTILAASGWSGAGGLLPDRPSASKVAHYSGAGKLHIVVSPDGMKALVANFPEDFYQTADFSLNDTWLKNEIARYGISSEASAPYLKDLSEAIRHKESLNDMIVAIGMESVGGRKPYLHTSFEEGSDIESNHTNEVVNIRNVQKKNFAKAGQLIASVRYQNPPKAGKNVYGELLEASRHEEFHVETGEGVEERRPGRFYALFDGVPSVHNNSLSLTKTMVHKGDVNLRSGNITFDGPVEVLGSIDSGAYVHVSGNLTVRGSVRNAFVRCGGDLEVSHGIVTGRKGLIHANGHVRAEFIENSTLQCGGSLLVKKAILNSNIIAGGKITLLDKKQSVIAGGMVSCRENIYTANLGFKNGNVTQINAGVDWQTELSVRIRSHRIEKVQEVHIKDRQALREITSKKQSQMTEKHVQRKKFYQERLVKGRKLLEHMERHLEHARSQLVYDQDVKIFVAETLFANVDLHVGGSPVQISEDNAGVAILGKRRRGSKIMPIETALEMEKEEKPSDNSSF